MTAHNEMQLTEMTSVNRMNLSRQPLVTAVGAWDWLKSSLCKRHAGRAWVALANPEPSPHRSGSRWLCLVKVDQSVLIALSLLWPGRLDFLGPTYCQDLFTGAHLGHATSSVSCWAVSTRQEEQRSPEFGSWQCGFSGSMAFIISLPYHSST